MGVGFAMRIPLIVLVALVIFGVWWFLKRRTA